MDNIDKITGILKISIINLDFELKQYNIKDIYVGGLCINNCIVTNYIPGIDSASFYTNNQLNNNINDWDNAYKLKIESYSKMWDYVKFTIISEINNNFINFYEINKIISNKLILKKIFKIYGHIHQYINIIKFENINMIHDNLPKQQYILAEKMESYSGSIIYTIINKRLCILGFTSSNYYNMTRIVPLNNIFYNDILIDLKLEKIVFNSKLYTQYKSNDKLFLEPFLYNNDIILNINNIKIQNNYIFNKELNIIQSINEYITYQKNDILFTILRRDEYRYNKIKIIVNINKMFVGFINNIYIDIKHLDFNNLLFNSDLCDMLLENNIYHEDVINYLENPNYKILSILI
jgi:hypothetical protein